MKHIRRFSAVIIGFVFFLAGVLKLMDPLGTSLIVSAYFKFMHLGFLDGAAMFLGCSLAFVETFIGAALVTGVWRKATAVASGAVLASFTILTLVLWLRNPEMDCGCFGEAIHLDHFQSFIKNIILDALWLLAFIPMDKGKPRKSKYAAFGLTVLSCIAFFIYSTVSVPLMDFTDLKAGVEISETPSFSFFDGEWNYSDTLAAKGRVMVVSVYDPSGLKEGKWAKIEDFRRSCAEAGITCFVIASDLTDAVPDCYMADRKLLMTLNRSNGGSTLLYDGQIITKWPFSGLPSTDRLAEMETLSPYEVGMDRNSPRRLKMQGFLLYVTAVMILL